MTLAELLIALVVMSLVVASAATMMIATARATDASGDARKDVVRTAGVSHRLHSDIKSARSFLSVGADELVLWGDDDNESGMVNLDEIVLVQRNSGSNELRRWKVVWPAGWSQATIDAANTSYASSSNFSTAANNAKALAYFPSTLYTTKATTFSPALDNATPVSARLATITLTLTESGVARTSYVVAGLRSATAPQ